MKTATITEVANGFVIECDGHEFHERTKAQAAHDKARDRELQGRGYQVLRFAGSEIWRAPFEVASEILMAIHTAIMDAVMKTKAVLEQRPQP